MMCEALELSDEQQRQLQLNELELIVEADRICRKHHIQYSLDGGTLLGAVRHKGFIPWDDDADIIMTRHEYAKFYKACKKELQKDKFFLQEYRTDPYYRWGYAKLRNLGTEYVRTGQEHMKYRTGVCIDIFVVDNMPDNLILRKMYHGLNFCIRKVLYSEIGMVHAGNLFLKGCYSLLYLFPKKWAFQIRNRMASVCNRTKTRLVNQYLYPLPKRCKYGVPASFFDKFVELEFEGMQFMAMKQYDAYLKLLYGDYMQLPPKEKQVGINTACRIKLKEITLEAVQSQYFHGK